MTFVGRQIKFVLISVIFSFILAVALAEVSLGVKENYEKKTILDYSDTTRTQNQHLGWGGFLKENLNIYVADGLGSRVRWVDNAAGFRSDREFSREPAPGVLRILSLGDSFNVGFRVDQNEVFSHLREEWVNRKYGEAEILVAETEEPATALYYLDKFGLQLAPHIVILGITLGNDIAEAYSGLGPHGRYILTTTKGQVQIEFNQKPLPGLNLAAYKIPPQYLKSENPLQRFIRRASRWLTRRHVLRRFYQQHEAITSWGDRDNLCLFDYNNGFGMFTDPFPPEVEKAYQRLFRILEAFSLLCRQHGMIFAVQIFPQRYQVQPEDWVRAVQEYGLESSRFNLMGPNQKIDSFCREHGIVCIDPTAAMAKWYSENKKPMYLPRGDMHWNKTGQRAFFECSLAGFANLVQEGFQEVRASNPKGVPRDKISRGAPGHKPESITPGMPGAGGS